MTTAAWGMRPDDLHGAGARVAATDVDAAAAASALVTAMAAAPPAAHHPVLRAALERYQSVVAGPTGMLPSAVTAAGSRLSTAAVDAAQADAEAARGLRAADR
ncbi:hypothetical protein KV102_01035 [Mumia sp. zg.B53]|uniref:hypothetical protein n=1 Tax=unclassified Mumia TaxID=2621872 RepID=UPI001C6E5279|nr:MULTISPECIES: hypothetical protein [unclassified Mumia]MBW9205198.1 hypothetical protein [Mumia sp. zg.B17]MBW9213412.1 hypothetical protein [Mumia sp. zg.B53]